MAESAKNPAAVALAALSVAALTPAHRKKLGAMGGRARAASLTAKQRKEIARKAAAARWGKKGAA